MYKKKESVYLDTTIPSAYFDKREPEKMKMARKLWRFLPLKYNVYISDVTIEEMRATPDAYRRAQMVKLTEKITIISASEDVKKLTKGYVIDGIIPEKHIEDALHMAIASLNKIDFFVTWNCTHIAGAHKRKKIRLYNASIGIFCPEIVMPEEILQEEE